MKEVIVWKDEQHGVRAEIKDVVIPHPDADEVLIKVEVAGTNPKDWKFPALIPNGDGWNTGDDVAGYVHSVGANVTEFKPGDRVAAMHKVRAAHGAFAEYSIAPSKSTFHIPHETSFEEAATIPLAAATAVVALHAELGLPERWAPPCKARDDSKGGVVVYGAGGAVGAFAVKLLRRADIHPIIAVAGKSVAFVETLLDHTKGDVAVDYRQDVSKLVQAIKAAVPAGQSLLYAFDAICEGDSTKTLYQVLAPNGKITVVFPGKEPVPGHITQTRTNVGSVHGNPIDLSDLAFAWFRLFGLGLREGWWTGHPHVVIKGGLTGVERGLRNLRDRKANALKYVYRIQETPSTEANFPVES